MLFSHVGQEAATRDLLVDLVVSGTVQYLQALSL